MYVQRIGRTHTGRNRPCWDDELASVEGLWGNQRDVLRKKLFSAVGNVHCGRQQCPRLLGRQNWSTVQTLLCLLYYILSSEELDRSKVVGWVERDHDLRRSTGSRGDNHHDIIDGCYLRHSVLCSSGHIEDSLLIKDVHKWQRWDNFWENWIITNVRQPLLAEAFVSISFYSSVFEVDLHASAGAERLKSYLEVFGLLLWGYQLEVVNLNHFHLKAYV